MNRIKVGNSYADCLRVFENICEIYPTAGPSHLSEHTQVLDDLIALSNGKREAEIEESLSASELLSIMIHASEHARKICSQENKMNELLIAIAKWKNRDPEFPEELEWCENCHSALRRVLLNRSQAKRTFQKLEGIELALRIRAVPNGQILALKMLSIVIENDIESCRKVIDASGLKHIFPIWMSGDSHHNDKANKKLKMEEKDDFAINEATHIISTLALMLLPTDIQYARLRAKFIEPGKFERLIELHRLATTQVNTRVTELENIEREEDDDDDDDASVNSEEREYLDLLDHGLDKLQHLDIILGRLFADKNEETLSAKINTIVKGDEGIVLKDEVRQVLAELAERYVVITSDDIVDEDLTTQIKANLIKFGMF